MTVIKIFATVGIMVAFQSSFINPSSTIIDRRYDRNCTSFFHGYRHALRYKNDENNYYVLLFINLRFFLIEQMKKSFCTRVNKEIYTCDILQYWLKNYKNKWIIITSLLYKTGTNEEIYTCYSCINKEIYTCHIFQYWLKNYKTRISE